MNKNMLYRSIPKVDVLLEDVRIRHAIEKYSRDAVMEAVHMEMDKLRKYIAEAEDESAAKARIFELVPNIVQSVVAMHTPNMRMVINGTGTILHTNLGRAPISKEHMQKAFDLVTGYSNLEYDLEAGKEESGILILRNCFARLQGRRPRWR